MPIKYYYADNSTRGFPDEIEFQHFRFVAGTYTGVFATEKPKQQEVLDALTHKNMAVKEITKEEYDAFLNIAPAPAEKTDIIFKRPPLEKRAPLTLDMTLSDQPGVIREGPAEVPVEKPTGEPVATVKDAVVVGAI